VQLISNQAWFFVSLVAIILINVAVFGVASQRFQLHGEFWEASPVSTLIIGITLCNLVSTIMFLGGIFTSPIPQARMWMYFDILVSVVVVSIVLNVIISVKVHLSFVSQTDNSLFYVSQHTFGENSDKNRRFIKWLNTNTPVSVVYGVLGAFNVHAWRVSTSHIFGNNVIFDSNLCEENQVRMQLLAFVPLLVEYVPKILISAHLIQVSYPMSVWPLIVFILSVVNVMVSFVVAFVSFRAAKVKNDIVMDSVMLMDDVDSHGTGLDSKLAM